MRRRHGQWSFVGVVTGWAMSYGLCRLALATTGLLDYFSEHCWPWSYCIGIAYRLGIINQVKKVDTSVIRTFHLSSMAANQPVDKGVWIIEVALYHMFHNIHVPSPGSPYHTIWIVCVLFPISHYRSKCHPTYLPQYGIAIIGHHNPTHWVHQHFQHSTRSKTSPDHISYSLYKPITTVP